MAAAASNTTMAISRQKSFPKEDANFLRLFILINKIGIQVCYDIFHRYFSKNNKVLYQQLLPFKKILKPFLFQSQFDLIYGDANQVTDSTKFDITLFLLLIRKTCSLLPPPKKGWNRRPSQSDISEAANLERLRIERNFLAHAGNDNLDTATFNKRWQIAEAILVALGASQTEIDNFKTKALDETNVNMEEELSILHDLLIQHIDVSFTKYSENEQKILALEDKITTLHTKHQHSDQTLESQCSTEDVRRRLQTTYLRNECTIPCIEWDVNNKGFFHLEEIYIEPRIHEWKPQRLQQTNDKGYLTIYEMLGKHKHVSLSACIFSDPGRGKSVLMKRIAVDFAQNSDTFTNQLPGISFVLLIKCKELLEYDSMENYIDDKLVRNSNIDTKQVFNVLQQNNEKCLFLVDGLDEIMHAEKSQSIIDLYELLQGKSFADSSIISTSRPSGLKTMETQFSMFRDLYIISALENEDIFEYIKKYFSEKEEDYCKGVYEHLINDDHIRQLVSSPLTLSIICNIYDDSDGPVPHSITKLYHELVKQMIQKFKNYHGFTGCETNKQGTRRVSECLLKSVGFVAFQSLKSGNDYFEHQDLVNYVVSKQKRTSVFSRAKRWLRGLNPTSVLQLGFIKADTGSNPRKLNLRYQFEPKMCQKYIAAEYIVNQLLKHGSKRMNELLDIELDNDSGQIVRTNHELCVFIVDSLGRRGEKSLCKELFNNLFKDFGSL